MMRWGQSTVREARSRRCNFCLGFLACFVTVAPRRQPAARGAREVRAGV